MHLVDFTLLRADCERLILVTITVACGGSPPTRASRQSLPISVINLVNRLVHLRLKFYLDGLLSLFRLCFFLDPFLIFFDFLLDFVKLAENTSYFHRKVETLLLDEVFER